jgi:hypothetical protein
MAKQPKQQRSSSGPSKSKTNGWDVLIRFLDVINDLFKTGNIFGAVLLLIFGYAIFVTHKLPPENVNAFILMLAHWLRAEKFYIIPGSSLLIVSLSANYLQHKYYTKEINRLVDIRSTLIHGFKVGDMEILPEHSSSEFNIEDTD